MLVINRKKNESILIGDNIYVKILHLDKKDEVSIGISAPIEIKILRTELLDEKQQLDLFRRNGRH